MNKLVLVDDEMFVRKGLISLIDWEACGIEVIGEADNGEDALKVINSTKPDIVITDIRMPVLSGLELIQKTIEANENAPKFIIVSGYNDFKYAQQAVRYGVHDFILKPIDKDEMESTLKKLSQSLQQEKQDRAKREQIRTQILLKEALSGAIVEEMKPQYVNLLRIANCSKFFYVIMEINNSLLADTVESKIKAALRYVTKSSADIPIYRQADSIYGAVLTSQDIGLYKNSLELLVEKLQLELSRTIEAEIGMYVGKPIDTLDLLKESFIAANYALQFKYAQSTMEPIFYEHVKDSAINYTEMDNAMYALLMAHVEEKDEWSLRKVIGEMFAEFQLKRFAPEAVKTTINRCIHSVIATIKKLEGNENELTTIDAMINWQRYHFTPMELKKRFVEFILEAMGLICNLRKQNAKGDIYKVKLYIESHYHENISLKTIANKFYMNPVYMGQLFKKTYGIYFKEFLLELRINEAKRLLRQTNMKVYKIGEQVGFGSTDYFVTQFEKLEGVTPTEYRNHILS